MIHICLTLAAGLLAQPAFAQQIAGPSQPVRDDRWEPLFLGYGTEPGMDYSGRMLSSLDSLASRSIGSINHLWSKHAAVAPAWEFLAASLPLIMQHEMGGHGGRAREFGLDPSYGLAHTTLGIPPHTNEESALCFAGGVEGEGVMAHRILSNSLRPEGVDGAKVPLALLAKLSFAYYAAKTHKPDDSRFVEQYRSGNDIAGYLLSRQAQRQGIDLAAAGQGRYAPDLTDPLLEKNWRAVRAAALWNSLDPSLVTSVVGYVRDHARDGHVCVHAPFWHLTDRVGLSLGTRAALGPQEVSRFLDVYATTPWGVGTAYFRRLDSSVDGAWGFGVAAQAVRLARGTTAGLAADIWKDPVALEHLPREQGWNVGAQIDAHIVGRWGVAATLGTKSRGSFPGLPLKAGFYAGFGLLASW